MPERPTHAELFENLRIELRSGCLVLATLAQLRVEHYGYSLRKALAEIGLEIEENTLYPMLRRLEKQGLLVSEWREEDKRKKRFYRLSPDGERILADLFDEWDGIDGAIRRIRRREMNRDVVA
ncbi:MAG TPA: helix-turn-helix transcriptional regulator [Gammaproteobacteria bacterium]|nr:helix-turn-helix transcriptional regulator [Gammaproteobacteria bacterium]